MGIDFTERDFDDFYQFLDADGNGSISLKEFEQGLSSEYDIHTILENSQNLPNVTFPLTADEFDAEVRTTILSTQRLNVTMKCGAMKARHEKEQAELGSEDVRNEGESSHFRKGKSGDWRSHMSLDQRRRFAAIMAERLAGSGLEDAFDRDDAV